MRKAHAAIAALLMTASLGVSVPLAAAQAGPTRIAVRPAAQVSVGLGVIGGVNDKGFNALANRGLQQAVSQLHVKGRVIVTPQNGNYASTLRAFVNARDNLVIAVGALWGGAVYQVARANKQTQFAIVDGFPLDSKNRPRLLSNVATLQFKSEQSGYVAGVIAGLMEKNRVGAARHNVIAALGALPLPFITSMMCGYWHGAKSVDKSVKFVDAFVNNFFDPTTAQSIGQKQIQNDNADILFGVADASGLGYYKAAANAHRYAIGFAADQDWLGNFMLTSAQVGISVAVFRTIKSEVNHTFKPYRHEFSFANGGISYAKDMHHVPVYIRAHAAKTASKLASNKLVVNPNCKLPTM